MPFLIDPLILLLLTFHPYWGPDYRDPLGQECLLRIAVDLLLVARLLFNSDKPLEAEEQLS